LRNACAEDGTSGEQPNDERFAHLPSLQLARTFVRRAYVIHLLANHKIVGLIDILFKYETDTK